MELQLASLEFLLTLGMPISISHCEYHLFCFLRQKKTGENCLIHEEQSPLISTYGSTWTADGLFVWVILEGRGGG